jgi:tetratricopeptide (TPR) repeat protein
MDMAVSDKGDTASESESKAKVFISYSRRDMDFVDRLEPALLAQGFKTLIDREEIYAFEDWWKRIETLVTGADTVVFVLSPDSATSEVCGKEIACAAEHNKRFAPIVCRRIDEKLVPEALAKLNFIFFDDATQFDASLARLTEALQTDIGWIRKHTEFGEAARRWAEAGRSSSSGLLLRSPVLEDAEHWIASRPPNAPAPTEATQAYIAQSRSAATRRRNILTGSLTAGLVIALGLAAWAYEERGVAIVQTGLAQRNFTAAKSTVDSVVNDIADGLKDVEGMRADTLRRILGRAENAVNELASRTNNDPEVRFSQGSMYTLFAETYLRVGATDVAGSYAQKGVDTMRSLLADKPNNVELQRQVTRSLGALGDVLRAKGDRKGALAAYQQAVAVARASVAKHPDDGGLQRDLAAGMARTGDILFDQGDLPEALAAFQESFNTLRALAAKNPDDMQLQRELSIGFDDLGLVQRAQGDFADALAAFRQYVGIARTATTKDAANTQWQRDLSLGLNHVGSVLADQGNLAGALAAYKESVDAVRVLAAKDPGNAEWKDNVAANLHFVGEVQAAQGDFAGALATYNESLDLERQLVARDPSNTYLQREVSLSLNFIGRVQQQKGDLASALTAYKQSIDAARALAAKNPSNSDWQRDIATGLQAIGNVLLSEKNAKDALAAYRESLDIAKALSAKQPDNSEWQRDVGVGMAKIGQVLLAQGDQAGALAEFHQSLDIRRALVAKEPDRTQWQVDERIILGVIGTILEGQGDKHGAIAAYQEAADIGRKLVAQNPDNAQAQIDLYALLYSLSGVADPPLARAALTEALAIIDKLAQQHQLSAAQQNWPALTRTALSKLP